MKPGAAGVLAGLAALAAILLRAPTPPAAACRAALAVCAASPPASAPAPAPPATGAGAAAAERPHAYPDDVLALARELVAVPSATGSEGAAGEYVAEWLRRRGWRVELQAVGGEEAALFNVVALPPGVAGIGAVDVVLSTHFDTVPVDIAGVREEEGRLYGRGAVDAKGLLAGMLVAADAVAGRGGDGSGDGARVGLLFVCGEERGHAGMLAANDLGFRADVDVVNGEPTEGRVCVAQKGALNMRLDARGVACHSGYPELGRSAIDALLDVLADIRAHDWPVDAETGAATTVNIGPIQGGSAPNVVAATASATLLFRLVGPVAPVAETVSALAARAAGVSASVVASNGPLRMYAPPRALAALGSYTAAYNTDLSYFARASKKVLFGAGSIANAHVADEYIEVAALRALPGHYADIVRELLAERHAADGAGA